MSMILTLPWPPSMNHYWRSVAMGRSVRVLISARGRAYRAQVARSVALKATVGASGRHPLAGRLAVTVTAYPPDRRRRDLDNLGKALLDACTHAGIWLDDSQIDDLRIVRGQVAKPALVEIEINEISERQAA